MKTHKHASLEIIQKQILQMFIEHIGLEAEIKEHKNPA